MRLVGSVAGEPASVGARTRMKVSSVQSAGLLCGEMGIQFEHSMWRVP